MFAHADIAKINPYDDSSIILPSSTELYTLHRHCTIYTYWWKEQAPFSFISTCHSILELHVTLLSFYSLYLWSNSSKKNRKNRLLLFLLIYSHLFLVFFLIFSHWAYKSSTFSPHNKLQTSSKVIIISDNSTIKPTTYINAHNFLRKQWIFTRFAFLAFEKGYNSRKNYMLYGAFWQFPFTALSITKHQKHKKNRLAVELRRKFYFIHHSFNKTKRIKVRKFVSSSLLFYCFTVFFFSQLFRFRNERKSIFNWK